MNNFCLYELADDFALLYAQIDAVDPDDPNYDALMEAFLDTLEGLEGAFDQKAEQVALFAKNLSAQVQALKTEEEHLYKRRKTKENKIKRLEQYLLVNLLKMEKNKVETPRAVLRLTASRACEILDEPRLTKLALEKYPACVTHKEEFKLNKNELKRLLKQGERFDGLVRISEEKQLKIS